MKFLLECIKGIMIGIANAIPGVSGGTMMVSMGIYDKIIGSVTGLFHHFKKSVLTLLPYMIGMAVGIVGLSFSIKFLLSEYPFQTSLLFIGLILGGLPALTAHVKKKSLHFSEIIVFLILFAFIIGLQIFGGSGAANTVITVSFFEIIKLFLVGVIAAATMVVPGVSGSMVLMILGYYYPIITLITEFVTAVISFDVPQILHICAILVPFGIGVLVGIFAIAKLIELLLKNFESHTYCGILGLVIASPIVILMCNGIPALNVITILTGVAAFAVGGTIAYFLGRE